LLGPFGRFSLSGARCRSSVVEHSIGNGEVDSSILSGSTIPLHAKALQNQHKSKFSFDCRSRPFQLFRPEQTVKNCVNRHKTCTTVRILSAAIFRLGRSSFDEFPVGKWTICKPVCQGPASTATRAAEPSIARVDHRRPLSTAQRSAAHLGAADVSCPMLERPLRMCQGSAATSAGPPASPSELCHLQAVPAVTTTPAGARQVVGGSTF
jgi:hypothetical protein